MCNYSKEELVGKPTKAEMLDFCRKENINLRSFNKNDPQHVFQEDLMIPGGEPDMILYPTHTEGFSKLNDFINDWQTAKLKELPEEQQRLNNSATLNTYLYVKEQAADLRQIKNDTFNSYLLLKDIKALLEESKEARSKADKLVEDMMHQQPIKISFQSGPTGEGGAPLN